MEKNYDFSDGVRNTSPIENKGTFNVRVNCDITDPNEENSKENICEYTITYKSMLNPNVAVL
jgi:hypothetical protein